MTRIERELERAREREKITARAEAMEEQQAEDEEYTLEDLYRRVPVKKERYRVNFRKIQVADAHKYVGSTIKLTRRNVGEKEYRLTGAKGGALQVMQKNGSGSFSFAFRKRDIEQIRVLIKEPY
jgi:molybdopterin converting factor small subunit